MLRFLLCALLPLAGLAQAQELLLNSFESEDDLAVIVPRDTKVRPTEKGVTHGTRALEIEFSRVAFPALFFRPAAPLDLREWGEIAYDITNTGNAPVRFNVRVDDDYRPDGVGTSRNGVGTLEPGATATFVFPLANRDPLAFGMRGLPTGPDARNLGSTGTHILNLASIAQMQIFLPSPTEPITLILDNLRLRKAFPLERIVDRFGQFAPATWPGKLTADEDFPARRATEEAFLSTTGTFGGRSLYGGYAAGPRLEPTGFFRAAKHAGRWWLVDPDGWLFFSTGFNSISLSQTTFTTARESMFTWLPSDTDPLARHYGTATAVQGPIPSGTTYNFQTANLERKYGPSYVEDWRATALARLPAWGFNTIGNWSDPALHRRGVAYVTTASLWGSFNTVPNLGQGTDRLPDPFDPRFATDVNARLLPVLTPALGDPWCLGHFVDNELNWGSTASDRTRYGVALGALAQSAANSPARRALGTLLATRYGAIANLNAAWGTQFADWNALTAPATITAAMRPDLALLTTAYAREYFRVVRDEIRRIDPDHLYLGSRFHINNPDIIAGAAEMTDVLSFNIYQQAIVPANWAILQQLDRPALIGEFHFGALDRGMFHTGLQSTGSQAERAAAFTRYLQSVADHPNFVGAHWFQYTDQALTGRPRDGENYNIGFVTIVDTPYPEMVNAARDLHEGIYLRRLR
ncbi:MAG: beta-galactosidase [Acidobacteria bacterium]|nr:beta-galactosidase [Acidobacteriota bacterium]